MIAQRKNVSGCCVCKQRVLLTTTTTSSIPAVVAILIRHCLLLLPPPPLHACRTPEFEFELEEAEPGVMVDERDRTGVIGSGIPEA
jgi:hypothetical protein